MLLRLALEVIDRIVAALPARIAYAVADLGGDAWRRFAPERRRVVAANLARVSAATGRPTSGRAFDALVAKAFRHHARYYVELLRAPHLDPDRITEVVRVDDWAEYRALIDRGPTLLASWHLGNFEPFGIYLAAHGYSATTPIEEIRPRQLYEFLAARRGGARGVELVPLSGARRRLVQRLRAGGLVGIVADRDLAGDGMRVEVFGHPTTFPTGSATLCVISGAGLIAGRALRVGRERYVVEGEIVDVPRTADRRADVEALTRRLVARFERDVAEAPDQWWGAFQPFWPDLRHEAAAGARR